MDKDEFEDLTDVNDTDLDSDENTLKGNNSSLSIDELVLGRVSDDEGEDYFEDARDDHDDIAFKEITNCASSKQQKDNSKEYSQTQSSTIENKIPLKIHDIEVLIELKEADQQATNTVKIVEELKRRISEIQNKEYMTEEDNVELQVINKQLKDELQKLENITRKVQSLVGIVDNNTSTLKNFLEDFKTHTPSLCNSLSSAVSKQEFDEDYLPKVIICGPTNGRIPSIIVCENVKQARLNSSKYSNRALPDAVAKRTLSNEANTEKPATKAEMSSNDKTYECLQLRLNSLEAELKSVKNENVILVQKLNRLASMGDKGACGLCPADVEYRLQMYKNNAIVLEKQLSVMTTEMCWLQGELIKVHKDRDVLQDLLKNKDNSSPSIGYEVGKMELRNLKEQYRRLEEDYKQKVSEVSVLTKNCEELSLKVIDDKVGNITGSLKAIEGKFSNGFKGGCTGDAANVEIQLKVARRRLSEYQDEQEELKTLCTEQQERLAEYKTKYLSSQQIIEQQRHQLENIRLDNAKISEQINIEVQRVKNSFNDKLKNLAPLPYILEETNMKLEEALVGKSKAEKNLAAITKEFQLFKDKAHLMAKDIEKGRYTLKKDDYQLMNGSDLEQQIYYLAKENEELRAAAETTAENEKRMEKKLHEAKQLARQLENVREESARQVSRAKERTEIARKSMQAQITELETNLTHSRAATNFAERDRDEIRRRMQGQIDYLNLNFEDARSRIQNLQMHVNFLKTAIPNSEEQSVKNTIRESPSDFL